jgi:hypothetical protein
MLILPNQNPLLINQAQAQQNAIQLKQLQMMHLETVLKAFMAETGLKASEVELVQSVDAVTREIFWYFRKRHDLPPAVEEPKETDKKSE